MRLPLRGRGIGHRRWRRWRRVGRRIWPRQSEKDPCAARPQLLAVGGAEAPGGERGRPQQRASTSAGVLFMSGDAALARGAPQRGWPRRRRPLRAALLTQRPPRRADAPHGSAPRQGHYWLEGPYWLLRRYEFLLGGPYLLLRRC